MNPPPSAHQTIAMDKVAVHAFAVWVLSAAVATVQRN